MTRRRFGYRYQEDLRDLPAATTPRLLFGGVDGVRFRRSWPMPWTPLDQGDLPACTGFAAAGWLRWAVRETHAQRIAPYLYYGAQRFDVLPGQDYEGSTVRGAMKFLRAVGVLKGFVFADSVAAIANLVLYSGPVVMGTDWFAGMTRPKVDARGVRWARPTGQIQGGHAWLIRGADVKREYFVIRNSWGGEWLDARITYADLELLLADSGFEACFPLVPQ